MKDKKRALSDDIIINLFWGRNEKAIEMLDKEYGKYLFKVQFNILQNAEDVKECQNDLYYQLWCRIPPERPKSLIAFITKIARDIAINRYNKNKEKKHIPSELYVSIDEIYEVISDNSSVDQQFDEQCLADLINRFLAHLSKKDRTIFICRYYYMDTIESIASLLNVSERAVYSAISKMKNKLKTYLEGEGYEHF